MEDVEELSIDDWNQIEKESEINYPAEDGDIVISIYGVMFLIQRTNNVNNIICFRIKKSKKTFLNCLFLLKDFLCMKKIQYIRVEGNLRRYFFLAKIKNAGRMYNVIQDRMNKERNVFYVRLY